MRYERYSLSATISDEAPQAFSKAQQSFFRKYNLVRAKTVFQDTQVHLS